jgi:DNA-binding MarR family transcriptional regulator
VNNASTDAATEVWRTLSDLVLDANRKAAVAEALGMSFARVRALRRLAEEPQSMRALAELLAADPPYVTLIVDDLEQRGFAKRIPHPDDRRAKIVRLTAAGRAAAARANAILDAPPSQLAELPPSDLAALKRITDRLKRGAG